MPEEKRDWNKIVAESKGQLVFVPEQFIEKAKEWETIRQELLKMVNLTSRKELEATTKLNNLSYEIRKFLAENGKGDEVWTKDIGFEAGALKDGQFIISITEGKKI